MAKKAKRPISSFERALEFLSLAHLPSVDQSIYCNMDNFQATAFNMIIALGTSIEEDLCACPHTALLLAAIERCPERYAITQLSQQKLLVRSGDFHAYIPCVDPSALTWATPDAPVGILDDRFMEALEKVAGLASTKAESVVASSIQLNNGSVVASNLGVIMEAWHGLPFPDGLLIPKIAFNKLHKIKKKIVSFGFSDVSLTFHFEDQSWLLTRLFKDKWPDTKRHFATVDSFEIPAGLFEAVKKVRPFSVGHIYVEGNLVSSHPFHVKEEGGGLVLPFEGASCEPRTYNCDDLNFIAHFAERWNTSARPDGTMFFGDNIRGVIYHGHFPTAGTAPSDDKDIPF